VSCLPEFSRTQGLNVAWPECLFGGAPVEVQLGDIVGLQHDVGEVLPEDQRRGITEQTLARSCASLVTASIIW